MVCRTASTPGAPLLILFSLNEPTEAVFAGAKQSPAYKMLDASGLVEQAPSFADLANGGNPHRTHHWVSYCRQERAAEEPPCNSITEITSRPMLMPF